MPSIPYTASDFAPHWGSRLTGTHYLSVSWQELVWAAITVGKPGVAHLLSHGWHSISDVIVRSHTVYANLRQDLFGYHKSDLYHELDPTEKGASSYFMGMVAAKILCARLLHTPWLLHLSMFQAVGGVVSLNGRSQPDLVGIDRNGQWVVAEAKGRSGAFSADAMLNAKRQTRRLRRINGNYPHVRVAVQAYFTPELSFAISDPEEIEDEAYDLFLNENAAIRRYYSFPLEAIRNSVRRERFGGQEFQLETIDEVGVTLGLSTDMRQYLDSDESLKFAALRDRGNPKEDQTESPFSFSDGLFIELDERWSEDRMFDDPRMRRDG